MDRLKSILTLRNFGYLFFGLLALYAIKIARYPSDFTVFMEAARYLGEGKVPYDEWLYVSEGYYCHYFYSPFWATLLIPFGNVPPFYIQFFWLLLNLFFVYRLIALLKAYWSANIPSWVWLVLLVFSIRFLLYNLEMVQMTIFVLWGSIESLRLMETRRWGWGALLLAFIINVKLLPIVLIPYLVYRAQYKSVLLCFVFLGLFFLLPAIMLGWTFSWEAHLAWFETINPIKAEHLLETDLGPHSLTAWIPVLLTESEGVLQGQRNIMNLDRDKAILVMNLIRLCLIGLTLFVLKWPPFKRITQLEQSLYEISYLFLLIPLIFPHQQKYAFFCLLPAWFYLILSWHRMYLSRNTGGRSKQLRFLFLTALICCSFMLMTLTTDGLIGRDLNEITQHYKLITVGACLLIPALMMTKPNDIEISNKKETNR